MISRPLSMNTLVWIDASYQFVKGFHTELTTISSRYPPGSRSTFKEGTVLLCCCLQALHGAVSALSSLLLCSIGHSLSLYLSLSLLCSLSALSLSLSLSSFSSLSLLPDKASLKSMQGNVQLSSVLGCLVILSATLRLLKGRQGLIRPMGYRPIGT